MRPWVTRELSLCFALFCCLFLRIDDVRLFLVVLAETKVVLENVTIFLDWDVVAISDLITVETDAERHSFRDFLLLRPPKALPALSGTLESSVAEVLSSLFALASLSAATVLLRSAIWDLTSATFLLVGVPEVPLALLAFLVAMTVSLSISDILSQSE